jgi:hypothetical protein
VFQPQAKHEKPRADPSTYFFILINLHKLVKGKKSSYTLKNMKNDFSKSILFLFTLLLILIILKIIDLKSGLFTRLAQEVYEYLLG